MDVGCKSPTFFFLTIQIRGHMTATSNMVWGYKATVDEAGIVRSWNSSYDVNDMLLPESDFIGVDNGNAAINTLENMYPLIPPPQEIADRIEIRRIVKPTYGHNIFTYRFPILISVRKYTNFDVLTQYIDTLISKYGGVVVKVSSKSWNTLSSGDATSAIQGTDYYKASNIILKRNSDYPGHDVFVHDIEAATRRKKGAKTKERNKEKKKQEQIEKNKLEAEKRKVVIEKSKRIEAVIESIRKAQKAMYEDIPYLSEIITTEGTYYWNTDKKDILFMDGKVDRLECFIKMTKLHDKTRKKSSWRSLPSVWEFFDLFINEFELMTDPEFSHVNDQNDKRKPETLTWMKEEYKKIQKIRKKLKEKENKEIPPAIEQIS